MSAESVDKAEQILKSKLSDACEIKREEVKNPKVKIVGIGSTMNIDASEIEEDINSRNIGEYSSKAQVLHMYTNTKTKFCSVILEVNADLYKCIRNNNNRVFVGCQSCRVFDLINVKPCFNCGRIGHSGKKCTNITACLKCAKKHKTIECESTVLKCTNCLYSNTTFNTKYNANHVATDVNLCEILKGKIRKYIETTDYPIQPTLPSEVSIPIHYQERITDQRTSGPNFANQEKRKTTASSSTRQQQTGNNSRKASKVK